jgi:hypothetical protein
MSKKADVQEGRKPDLLKTDIPPFADVSKTAQSE